MKSIVLEYLIARIAEPSTWRGGAMLLTGLGIVISPEMLEAIVAVGASVSGLIGVLTKDRSRTAG